MSRRPTRRRMADWAAVRMLRRHRQWAILITAAGACWSRPAPSVDRRRERLEGAGLPEGRRLRALGRRQRADPDAAGGGARVRAGGDRTHQRDPATRAGPTSASTSHGNWRSGRVKITEVKRGSRWFVTGGVLTVDGKRFQMPCAPPISPTSCLLS